MKKYVLIGLLCVSLSSFALDLNIGAAYENLATGDTLDKPFISLKGNLSVDILPLLT